ncbi:MAG: bile acid:sodium symporter family protein [Ignavibacteriae bacterium]|nr:bile acid:sodium symporter family protein [Ignavibacteriota bacterium]
MESSFLSAVVLPLALAIIMIGVGLELKMSDFGLLFKNPKPVIAGILAQMFLLPILGIIVGLYLFEFTSPFIGAGFVIIALAPGGSTSNLFTLLAKGDLALSVSLTAIGSVITPFWLPFAAAIILSNISQTNEIEINLLKTFIELFVISVIPIVIGMLINAKKHSLSLKLRSPVKIISTIFLFLIIVALVIKNIDVLVTNISTVAPAALLLVVLAFFGGYIVSKLFATTYAQTISISIGVGIQNGTLALLITATILEIPEMTLAAIFYSLIMFIVGFGSVYYFKKTTPQSEMESVT